MNFHRLLFAEINQYITSISEAHASNASKSGLKFGSPNSTIARTALPILVAFNLFVRASYNIVAYSFTYTPNAKPKRTIKTNVFIINNNRIRFYMYKIYFFLSFLSTNYNLLLF